jgi:hypothetical protein
VADGTEADQTAWIFGVRLDVDINDCELRDIVTTKVNASGSASDADSITERLRDNLSYAEIYISLAVDCPAPRLLRDV